MVRTLLPPIRGADAQSPSVHSLWDAVDLYRLFALLYACYELAGRLDELRRPTGGWVVLAILGAWTLWLLVHRRRNDRQLVIELCLAVAAILSTIWIDDPQIRHAGASTIPGIWAGAIVLAAGVGRGPVAALAAWAIIVVADVIEIGTPTEGTIHNVFLLFIMALVAGLTSRAARSGDEALREGLRLRAEQAERERLARTVHDGVLQALAFIHRRGDELGGAARDLGDLAGRQEQRLRGLITGRPLEPVPLDGVADLTGMLRALIDERAVADERGSSAQIAAPADPVVVPARRAHPLVAAVAAALDNVAAHAGPDARTWILVEEEDEEVVVTVRDDGVGMADGRLAEAEAAGRLGVAASIVGRLHDLGGDATCRSAPEAGTSWELRMPHGDPAEQQR